MKKSDLQTGRVVELDNGWSGVVLADVELIIGEENGYSFDDYDDNLKSEIFSGCDIASVYSRPTITTDYLNTSLEHRTLLWQREEVKEMTEAEVSKALGYPVKVVGGE